MSTDNIRVSVCNAELTPLPTQILAVGIISDNSFAELKPMKLNKLGNWGAPLTRVPSILRNL